MCQEGLAEGGRVEREVRPDLQDLKRIVRPEDVVDDEYAVVVECADAHRLSGSDREVVGPGEGAASKLVDVEVDVPELKQRRTQLVLAALSLLLDEARLL
jgi:hypothetical protein